MKFSKFVEKNGDILVRQMHNADLETVTVGTPLFVASLAGGLKAQEDMTVTSASYGMAVHIHHNSDRTFHSIDVLALTRNGAAKIVNIKNVKAHERSNYAVFLAKPLPLGDERTHYTFNNFD